MGLIDRHYYYCCCCGWIYMSTGVVRGQPSARLDDSWAARGIYRLDLIERQHEWMSEGMIVYSWHALYVTLWYPWDLLVLQVRVLTHWNDVGPQALVLGEASPYKILRFIRHFWCLRIIGELYLRGVIYQILRPDVLLTFTLAKGSGAIQLLVENDTGWPNIHFWRNPTICILKCD